MKKDMIKDSLHDNGQPLFLALSEPPGKTVICELIDSSNLFIFTLAYSEPPEDFGELIRYRQELDFAAGRKNNYLGDVLIDLTNWTGSEDSDYLDAFLAYLYDNADGVRYIFAAGCFDCEAIENKISEYFSMEKRLLNLCTGELLKRHINQYFINNNCKISPKALVSLCNLFEKYANKKKTRLRSLEVMCDKIILCLDNKTIDDTTIKELIEPEINMRLGCSVATSLFGIGSMEEKL